MSLKFSQRNFPLVKVISQITKECNMPYTYYFFLFILLVFFFVDETFARLVDNYMRPAIHKGVPPLFNNIRNLYSDKEKVILRSCTASGFSSNFKVDSSDVKVGSLPTEFCR